MANLVAIAYPDEATAKEVLGVLGRLQTEQSIQIEDAVVVTRNQDGKVKLHQSAKPAAAGAAGGALWGGRSACSSSRRCSAWRSARRAGPRRAR
jgi:uncharacterized membrane protein